MKTTLLTFADNKYEHRRLATLSANFSMVDKIWNAVPDDIDEQFKHDNQFILSQPRGYGYWLWKPYLILQYMQKSCEDDEMLIYCDAGDYFSYNLLEISKKNIVDCLFVKGPFLNSMYTKRDCFILMDCDNEKYHNSQMTYASICFWKKTDTTMSFLEEWLRYCKNPNVLTDIENIHGDNLPNFVDHRHDQSVLTNLTIKYDMPRREQKGYCDNPWNVDE